MTEDTIDKKNPVSIRQAFTILSGQSESNQKDLQGVTIAAIQIPGVFTGTKLKIQGSADGAVFLDLYNVSAEKIEVDLVPGSFVVFSPQDLSGFRYIRLVSDAAEGADRELTALVRSY